MALAKTSSKWLFPVERKEQASIQLLCFPFAGGGASVYSTWQHLLRPEIQLWPIQLPGRENRFSEQPLHRIESLLAELEPVLQPMTEGSWALFGHSMGALLAVELVARLTENPRCQPPRHIFLSGKAPIHLPLQRPLIGLLEDEILLEHLQQRYGVDNTPEQQELMRLMLATIRADIQVVENHKRTRPVRLASPLTAFLGTEDKSVSEAEMAQWCEYTLKEFELVRIPGNHFYLQSSREQLVRWINHQLQP